MQQQHRQKQQKITVIDKDLALKRPLLIIDFARLHQKKKKIKSPKIKRKTKKSKEKKFVNLQKSDKAKQPTNSFENDV